MSDNVMRVIVAAIVCGSAAFVVVAIAVFAHADALVKAYKRWRGTMRPCPRCQGSGRYNGVVCSPCDGAGEIV